MSKTFVVANTKGGVGKSLISTMVIPAVYYGDGKNIRVYEMDNSNDTEKVFTNSSIQIKSLKANNSKETVFDISFDSLSGDDSIINIIDAGGSDDTHIVLKNLKKAMIDDVTYLVPINSDKEQLTNMRDTIRAIRAVDEDAQIYIIMNRCKSFVPSDIKEQFAYFFKEVDAEFRNIPALFIKEEPILGVLKSDMGMTLYDYLPTAFNMVDNFKQLRKEWYSKSVSLNDNREYYLKKMEEKDFADEVIDFYKSIGKLKSIK